MNAREKDRAQRRAKTEELGERGVPATEIARITRTPRATVIKWLGEAGIEPVMLRRQQPKAGGGSLSAGKALSIEEGVRRRVEKMGEEEDEAA